jgi:hypothetical protein
MGSANLSMWLYEMRTERDKGASLGIFADEWWRQARLTASSIGDALAHQSNRHPRHLPEIPRGSAISNWQTGDILNRAEF